MSDDLIGRLRAADPAGRDALRHADTRGMSEAIMATDGTTTAARPAGRRGLRRGLLAAVLATGLVGAGAAWAGYQQWYVQSSQGVSDGVKCATTWVGPTQDEPVASGPLLTGDPVPDCQEYQRLNGLPAITDPVAFWYADQLWVAPAGQVPDGARVQDDWSESVALRELQARANDVVDGLGAGCTSVEDATALVRADAQRLGVDWEVAPVTASGGAPEACAGVLVEPATRTVRVVTGPSASSSEGGATPGGPVATVRDALRAGVAQRCLDLDAAVAVADEALGFEHHWPTTAIEDPDADCTTVDMEVGGSILVTLRGPRP
ncbi:hypothetical protein GC089_17030 [Cellulomonas sp. JZ18]|uniref:hypothetical protein n=1 Tax=Cellulomonas sp. JZ18 TaxID=2654191 RepID=UPI0012D461E0|nr:hypothetical protein [Cellulomonas sp. JZ18]QGQ20579.1 hypothetical protein GC089_17030 [Cellulomonas sp. JZ18]